MPIALTRVLVASLVALSAATTVHAQQPASKPKAAAKSPASHDTSGHAAKTAEKPHADSAAHATKKTNPKKPQKATPTPAKP